MQSRGAKAYVAKLQRAQRAAAATLKRAIPSATVERNYTMLLNGMAVELPATQLAKAAKLSFARKLYPSYRYTLALNRSPGLIGAGALAARRRRQRRGDEDRRRRRRHRPDEHVLQPGGLQLPGRLPEGRHEVDDAEGDRRPLVRRRGRGRPHPPRASTRRPRSTGRTSPGSLRATPARPLPPAPTIPLTTGLSGVAPRAYIGNYRVFNVPTPVGHVGNTPEIVAAFESAVRDGMDVINFSGGGPQTDPLERRADRGGAERRGGRRRAR